LQEFLKFYGYCKVDMLIAVYGNKLLVGSKRGNDKPCCNS
jgi:hypothetical protein